MYGLIRLILGCAITSCIISKRSKTMHKRKQYVFAILIVVFLVTILAFIPFENMFITFNSPEDAFNYVNSEKAKLVIQGENSDFVIGEKDVADFTYLIVPKNDNGWKIGRGLDTKLRMKKVHKGIVIYVYQYKNTNDYFITILDTSGGYSQIIDSCDSKFLLLESASGSHGKTFVTYFASVPQYSQKYWINVNDEEITFPN